MMDVTFDLIRRKDGKLLGSFPFRKDAVFHANVNQTLPLPDNEWEDEFEIVERRLVFTEKDAAAS